MSTNVEARRAIEAILMVADQPIEPNLLAQVCEISAATVEEICRDLAAEYEADGRGFVLARVAGGYRYQSHPDMAAYVERFVLDGQSARLSAAALETLAIVAYKQPISRAQVASIRGVSVDGVMKTLQGRGYIAEVGRDAGPGNAVLFGTTSLFLERLGLDSVDELPALGAFVPGADVVEQLERTLRVSDDPAAGPPVAAEAAADPAPIEAVTEHLVDAADVVDAAEVVEVVEAAEVVEVVDEGDAVEAGTAVDAIEAGAAAEATTFDVADQSERVDSPPIGSGGGSPAGFPGGEAEGSVAGGIGGFVDGGSGSSSGAVAGDLPAPAGET